VFIPKEYYCRIMSRKPDQVLSAVKKPSSVTKDTTNKRVGVLGIKGKTPPGEKKQRDRLDILLKVEKNVYMSYNLLYKFITIKT
jgi:hypothetical protein